MQSSFGPTFSRSLPHLPPRATFQNIKLQFAISIIQECQHEIIQKPILLVLTGIKLQKSQLLVLGGVLHHSQGTCLLHHISDLHDTSSLLHC